MDCGILKCNVGPDAEEDRSDESKEKWCLEGADHGDAGEHQHALPNLSGVCAGMVAGSSFRDAVLVSDLSGTGRGCGIPQCLHADQIFLL